MNYIGFRCPEDEWIRVADSLWSKYRKIIELWFWMGMRMWHDVRECVEQANGNHLLPHLIRIDANCALLLMPNVHWYWDKRNVCFGVYTCRCHAGQYKCAENQTNGRDDASAIRTTRFEQKTFFHFPTNTHTRDIRIESYRICMYFLSVCALIARRCHDDLFLSVVLDRNGTHGRQHYAKTVPQSVWVCLPVQCACY